MPNTKHLKFPLVSNEFLKIREEISNNYLDYMLISIRRYLEKKFSIEIRIVIDCKVPPNASYSGTDVATGKIREIHVSSDDYANDRKDVIRFHLAHELGHIAHRHNLFERGAAIKGRGSTKDANYVSAKIRQEREADLFAFTLFNCQGSIVERKILTDKEFKSDIMPEKGFIHFIPVGKKDDYKAESILNKDEKREEIYSSLLKEHRCLYPPIRFICQSLRKIFDHKTKIEGISRLKVAEELHETYRNFLKSACKDEILSETEKCDDCPDYNRKMCPIFPKHDPSYIGADLMLSIGLKNPGALQPESAPTV